MKLREFSCVVVYSSLFLRVGSCVFFEFFFDEGKVNEVYFGFYGFFCRIYGNNNRLMMCEDFRCYIVIRMGYFFSLRVVERLF